MEELKLRDEFIKLGQAMKAAGIVSSGIDAKMLIQDGQVTVNGEVETRRGKKLYNRRRANLQIITTCCSQKHSSKEKGRIYYFFHTIHLH